MRIVKWDVGKERSRKIYLLKIETEQTYCSEVILTLSETLRLLLQELGLMLETILGYRIGD